MRKMDIVQGIFKDNKVLVVGLARSGIGAANLLSLFGAKVCVTDIKTRDLLEGDIKKLPSSIKVVLGEHPQEIFDTSDFIVVNPGVPRDISPLMHAERKGIPVIGELELAYRVIRSISKLQPPDSKIATPAFIAITGTNGKSTTTTLINMMLKNSGFKTLMGGNIGNALTEEVFKAFHASRLSPVDYIVAEVSSFQLESIQDFNPFISLILNITADHLNRYKTMEEYISAKARIFENHGPCDYLILNADDPEIMKLYNSRFPACRQGRQGDSRLNDINVLFFSRETEVKGIYYKNGSFFCTLHSTPGTSPSEFLKKGLVPPFHIIDADKIKIKGVHNLENAMAASLAALLCGCSVETVRGVLKDFSGLEHRLEFVCEIEGVTFINDSKGTNVGAVVKSLESFKNIVLIMGGKDKDGDFVILRDLIKEKVKLLILLGEAKEKIAEAICNAVETVFVKDMKEAVELSVSTASAGDIVLLSPGCASFDMFIDFEDRGKRFKEAVYAVQNSK